MADPFVDSFWHNQNGDYHRENGAAIELCDGTKEWFIDGKRHREDGPAVEYPDGRVYFWLRNFRYSFEEWLERTPLSIEEKVLMKLRYG